jgi:polysaccharide biosynthesis protein PelC
MSILKNIVICLAVISLAGCASTATEMYRDPNMDFGAVRTIAVMPFVNLSKDQLAGERVRDVFINALLATGAVYVLPTGEVARGVTRVEIQSPLTPSPEEIIKLGKAIKAEAIVVGTLREYGDVRSGSASANAISMSLQVMETETGKVVWSASTTKGGITFGDRLLGGGGQPMDVVTLKAVNDLINKLFK